MWQVYCPSCGHAVLVSLRRLRELINHPSGVIVVVLECPAGHPLAVRTGRATGARH